MPLLPVKKRSAHQGEKSIYFTLLPTVLGMILCAACLVGTTYAWFTATQTVPAQTIRAANYTVTMTVKKSKDSASAHVVGNTYELAAGENCKVRLTASGTATTGYCYVFVDGNPYYTGYMESGQTISFTITNESGEPISLTVISQWGAGHLVQPGDDRLLTDGADYQYAEGKLNSGKPGVTTNETAGADKAADSTQSAENSEETNAPAEAGDRTE